VNDVAKALEAVDDRSKDPGEPASTAATSVSGRGDLELRAKLNQKEADLLALRGELSARDRLLLELNNTTLEIERSRFELSELLEQHTLLLSEARERIRALEAEKEANEKRIADMKAAFRGSEANWKRKLESELESLKIEHAAELAAHASAHATKLEQVERGHAAEVERLLATHAAADEDAKTKHAEALKKAEAASNQALANVIAKYSKKVRSLQEVQEQALAKAAASHAATLEAAVAAAASDKATVIAEAESAQRAAQGELTTALGTIQFLERTQASQAERITRQESRIVTLEESLRAATERADAGEETLASLRRTLATGLSLLNPRTPEET
jgi:chromosome segregation ATPase